MGENFKSKSYRKMKFKEPFCECKGKMLLFLHGRQAAWGKRGTKLIFVLGQSFLIRMVAQGWADKLIMEFTLLFCLLSL